VTPSRPALLNALPDFGFAAVFLVTWVAPTAFGDHVVRSLFAVMLMEFIVVHSSVLMGTTALKAASRASRAGVIAAFGLFYSLFAGGFSLAFHSWWPLASFWGQTINRLLGVLLGQAPDGDQRALLQRGWTVAVVLYLVLCMATVLLPVPALGITPAVAAAQQIPGRGLWVDRPEKVIAFGFLYFLLTAWSEMGGHAWVKPPRGAATAPTSEGAATQ